ncbi:MAG: CocE/NonD family hydrolase C-terminal non-catalytic domain-containing protein [Xanthobacteraceae bacterium]
MCRRYRSAIQVCEKRAQAIVRTSHLCPLSKNLLSDRSAEVSLSIKASVEQAGNQRRRHRDTDFFIKLTDQVPRSSDDRGKGLNPFAELITRGWLRASHRALDPARSADMVPYHSHSDPQPLTPNEIYKFEISLEPMAYLIKQGHRLRLEIVNGDSPATKSCGRTITGPTRSEATRSITMRRIPRN